MAKFISGELLEKAVYDIIWEAKEQLLIVSPFIKLDDYFKRLFERHLNNHQLQITIVFGKNAKDVSKSLNSSDFDFFKRFLNISIIHVPNLHAKYYGNESNGVVSSINLYDYSFKNNIEFGVFYENKLLSKLTRNTDNEVWNTCWDIAEENQAIFIKRPVIEKRLFSSIFGNNYIKSEVLYDITLEKGRFTKKTINDFPDEMELGSEAAIRPSRNEFQKTSINDEIKKVMGYCIRSGVPIPFDIDKPLSDKAFRSWVQYENSEYPEKYCHFSGEPSNGETSMNRPILRKNWKLAMETHKPKMLVSGF